MFVTGKDPSRRRPSAMPFAASVLAVLAIVVSALIVPSPASAAQPIIQMTFPADNITTYEGQEVVFGVELYSNINLSATIIQWYRSSSPVIGQGLFFNYTPDFNSSGQYTVTVVVVYNTTSATHQWNLTVVEVKQRFTITSASPVGDIQLRELGTMSFSVVVDNPANDTLAYCWFIDDELRLGSNETEFAYTPGMDDAGERHVRVQVASKDNIDNRSWKVTVNAAIDVLPAGPQTIREGDTIQFTVLEPKVLEQDIKWSLDGATTPVVKGRNYTYRPDHVSSGMHNLKVNTSDGQSYSWAITVGDVDRAPTVGQGALMKVQTGKSLKFTGTASDPDNDIATYEWDFDGDGAFDFSADRQESTMHTYKKPGVYLAVFKVTDDHGQSATMIYPVQVTQPTSLSPWVVGSIVLGAIIVVVLLWIIVDVSKARKKARLDAEERVRDRDEAALRARAKASEARRPKKEELPLFEDVHEPVEGTAVDHSMVPYTAGMADRGQEAEGAAAEGEMPHLVEGEAADGGAVAEGSEVSKAEEKEELDVLLKSLAAKTGTKAELKSKKASAEAGAGEMEHELGPHMRKGKKVKVVPKVLPQQKKVQKKEPPKEDIKATGKGADSDIDAQSSDEVDQVMQKLVDMGLAERKKKNQ